MKRFHFATIHLIMIGLILFGIATIFVRVLKSESSISFFQLYRTGKIRCREARWLRQIRIFRCADDSGQDVGTEPKPVVCGCGLSDGLRTGGR